jgi:hypothetical protein
MRKLTLRIRDLVGIEPSAMQSSLAEYQTVAAAMPSAFTIGLF